jgi:hypothetical protein
VTSVVNCNPSNRTKLGIGSSLSLLHNMAGSGVSVDYMHYTANVFKYFILLMKGDRAVSDVCSK